MLAGRVQKPAGRALIIHGLLDDTDIAACHEAAREWPHQCELGQCDGGGPCAAIICDALQGRPHDQAIIPGYFPGSSHGNEHLPTGQQSLHTILYLHRERFLQTHAPAQQLWQKLDQAVRSPPKEWSPPGAPLPWTAKARSLSVRCIELHSYAPGAGLVDPNHRDEGSVLSISVLLSDPDLVGGGGRFVTFDDEPGAEHTGEPIVHELAKGDAILFRSQDRHNVSTVTSGIRQSLVIEMWDAETNITDRFS